jgi:hypothetical protein
LTWGNGVGVFIAREQKYTQIGGQAETRKESGRQNTRRTAMNNGPCVFKKQHLNINKKSLSTI